METSKATSPLLKFRAEKVVEPRIKELEAAFIKKDFDTFGQITMQDSNQFHATCMDTYPPIFYMNDVSKSIIRLVHVINEHFGRIVCAYTYDAGPNAVLYLLEKDTQLVMAVMTRFFPAPGEVSEYCNDVKFYSAVNSNPSLISSDLLNKLNKTGRTPIPNDVKYIFYTRSGPGPIQQSFDESLLDPKTGNPKPSGDPVYTKHKRMQIKPVVASHGDGWSMFKCPFTWSVIISALAVGTAAGFHLAKNLKK